MNIRMGKIADCLYGILDGNGKVLDVGAGNGYISYYLQNKFGCKIQCADIMNYLEYDFPFSKISGPKLSFNDDSFDIVMIIDALHHMAGDTQVAMLQEAARVAKKVFIFETKRTFIAMLLDHLINKLNNILMPVPCTHKTRNGWEKTFSDLGFEFKEIKIKRGWLYPLEHLCFIINKPIFTGYNELGVGE